MPLSADQNATLQLLLERGQSYSDLAALLGVDEAEVRTRARSALTELGGADPDRNVALTDYLVGQADPIGRADVVRHLRDDVDDHKLAGELTETLRTMYPNAELPRLPGEPRPAKRPRRARAADAGEGEAGDKTLSFSGEQTRLFVGLGAGALILIAIVLGVAGVFGGGDDDEPTTTTSSTTAGEETTATADGEELANVPLVAPGGGNATGEAIFGLATADQAYVDFTVENLDPAPQGKTYVIWLLLSDTKGYPLSPFAVSQQGTFSDRFAIESVVLPLIARVQFVDVSLVDNRELASEIRDAQERTSEPGADLGDLLLDIPGETVLRGALPREAAAAGQGGGAGAGE